MDDDKTKLDEIQEENEIIVASDAIDGEILDEVASDATDGLQVTKLTPLFSCKNLLKYAINNSAVIAPSTVL